MGLEDGSRDGKGAGDHNVTFEFGHPLAALTWHQHLDLLKLRGRVIDARQHGGREVLEDDVPPAVATITPLGVAIPVIYDDSGTPVPVTEDQRWGEDS